jgi:hypothetical protein
MSSVPFVDPPYQSFTPGRNRIDEKYSSSSWRSLSVPAPKQEVRPRDEIADEADRPGPTAAPPGRKSYPALALVLIVALDAAAVWLLRLIF